MTQTEETTYINKSLDKALKVLDLFDNSYHGLSVTEIAEEVGVKAGAMYPILNTLQHHGYLERDQDKKYKLGEKLLDKRALMLEEPNLSNQAYLELKKLRNKVGETIHLATISHGFVVYLEKLEPSDATLSMYSSVGKKSPVHATGLGKAILAYLPEKEVEQIISQRGLEKFTDNTIDSLKNLKEEIEQTRERGYAIDDAEHIEVIRCVACPIFNRNSRPVAAISVSVPTFEMEMKELVEIAPIVKNYALDISKKLGYKNH